MLDIWRSEEYARMNDIQINHIEGKLDTSYFVHEK